MARENLWLVKCTDRTAGGCASSTYLAQRIDCGSLWQLKDFVGRLAYRTISSRPNEAIRRYLGKSNGPVAGEAAVVAHRYWGAPHTWEPLHLGALVTVFSFGGLPALRPSQSNARHQQWPWGKTGTGSEAPGRARAKAIQA